MNFEAALLVTGRDGEGRPLARLVMETWDDEADNGRGASGCRVGERAYVVLPNDQPDEYRAKLLNLAAEVDVPEMAPGDVVVGSGPNGAPEGDGEAVLLRTARVLGRAADDAQACALVEAELGRHPAGDLRATLMTEADVAECVAQERARGEPNDALVFAWRTDDGDGLGTHIVDHRGAFLYFSTQEGQTCETAFLAEPPGPGLWLMRDGGYWETTDWESGTVDAHGVEGDYEQVAPEAAAQEFGMTVEELLAACEDAYDFERPVGMDLFEAAERDPEENFRIAEGGPKP